MRRVEDTGRIMREAVAFDLIEHDGDDLRDLPR